VDGAGNVYAAGYQYGTGPFDYGSGTVTGPSSYDNVVLVKYDAATGNAQWARTGTGGSDESWFTAVAVDGGAVYAAGYQGAGPFDYGSGTVTGPSYQNVVLVKYDASGNAQWAKTATTGSDMSRFNAVAVDGGAVYAAGYQGTGPFDYGSGTVTGPSSGENVILVKYDASGNAQWAKTLTACAYAIFYALALDGPAVYAAGHQYSTGLYDYGDGKTAAATGGFAGNNVALVKYPRD
jgi:hypothetical protein